MGIKVGIYTSRQTGGVHTFVSEILLALSELVEKSNHTFVLLASSEEGFERVRPYVKSSRIEVVFLKEISLSTSGKKRNARWLINAFRNRVFKVFNSAEMATKRENPFEQAARAYGIQLFWFLDQKYIGIPDLPYFATLFDLQHRLQPFFPEVGSGDIWDMREEGLSRYLQRAAMVITGSHTARSEIERFYQVPSERIRILPHPTPQFVLEPSPIDDGEVLARYGISEGYLFYPAQFWAHKNHVNLLLALHLLREEHGIAINMVFVGLDKGNEAHVRQTVAELNLSSQVRILGFVPQIDLITLYRNAFALTYMTFFGPDNLPPLEAFALECPVIASNVSGAEEQLGDAALLVDPKNPEEIADAILSLHSDPDLRATLLWRGKNRAAHWTSYDFVRGVFEIIDEFEPVRRCWN